MYQLYAVCNEQIKQGMFQVTNISSGSFKTTSAIIQPLSEKRLLYSVERLLAMTYYDLLQT